MEFTLLGAAAVAVAGFWLMLRWEAKRGNAEGCSLDLWDAGLTAGAVGLFAGRLVSMISVGISPIPNPSQIILVRSGVSTAGAAIGAAVMFAYLARKSLIETADAIGPAILAGLAGWHAGCLVTDSCLGAVSDFPWAQTVAGSTVTRHPVELYAMVLFGVASIGLALWKQYGRPPSGAVAGFTIAALGGIRLVTESVRISLSGGPIWLYSTALVIGLGIATASIVHSRNARTRRDHQV